VSVDAVGCAQIVIGRCSQGHGRMEQQVEQPRRLSHKDRHGMARCKLGRKCGVLHPILNSRYS
jgi:hypothetical protein